MNSTDAQASPSSPGSHWALYLTISLVSSLVVFLCVGLLVCKCLLKKPVYPHPLPQQEDSSSSRASPSKDDIVLDHNDISFQQQHPL